MHHLSFTLSPLILFSLCIACTSENDKVSDSGAIDSATNDTAAETDSDTIVDPAEVVPLYTSETELEPENHFDNGSAVIHVSLIEVVTDMP